MLNKSRIRTFTLFILLSSLGLFHAPKAHAQNLKLYFASLRDGRIFRSNINGTAKELLVQGMASPRDISFDLKNRKFYWVDEVNDSLHRANYDGSNPEELLKGFEMGIDLPTGLEIDSAAGKVYFTTGALRHISRSDLDGSNIETLIDTKLFGISEGPVALALDIANGKIYWTQKSNQIIQRANLADGSAVETILDLTNSDINSAGDIEIDSLGGKLYIHGGGIIARANLDGSNLENLYETLTNAATGIEINPESNELLWTEVDFFESLEDRVHLGTMDGGTSRVILTKFSDDLENPYALEIVDLKGDPNSIPTSPNILTPDTKLNAVLASLEGDKLTLHLDKFTGASLETSTAMQAAKKSKAKKLTFRYDIRVSGPTKASNRRIISKKDTLVIKKIKASGEYTISYSAIIYSKLSRAQKFKALAKGKKGLAAKFKKRKRTATSPSSLVQIE